jgi:CubicO group peptidase (beta-lactamase class C family)
MLGVNYGQNFIFKSQFHPMKKILKVLLYLVLSIVIVVVAYAAFTAPTIMTGMAAKTMCSCVYIAGRTPESVKKKELQVFPGLSSAGIEINNSDSSVTATVLWNKSKAIFRKGLGCTLISERSEHEVRSQKINLPTLPPEQDSIPWPTGNLVSNTPLADVNYKIINEAVAGAFADVDDENPVHTHAVLVVYNGKIIGEKYADGFDIHSKMMGWSMTKSITSALIGILVKEGKLKVSDPAPVPEWQDDERKKITLNNLLQASSGLDWSESYFVPTSHFHNMFIKRDDKGGYAANLKLKHKPGTFFQYSSGTTNLLSRTILQTVGDAEYYRLPYEKLFYKIGMSSAIIEPDASGTFVGSSYSFASARDWARFGMLYLNDGVWNGERILPEGWVKYSSTPATAATKREYGAQWWLNAGDPKNPADNKFPGLPAESILAEGFENQFIVIVPSKKLVVVRLGVTHNKNFSIDKLVNGVINALDAGG